LFAVVAVGAEVALFGDAVVEAGDVGGEDRRGMGEEPVVADEDGFGVGGIGFGGLEDGGIERVIDFDLVGHGVGAVGVSLGG